MEDRYEIRGKIGQGGLGAVYRGYDNRMNREVAIKRITTSGDGTDIEEESTRQLIKEAGALASLQHPNIVTVYDVGTDEDGPYVVMELISGKTLDELIEKAPLTWPDFRELAMQTQEALIAAQERKLIHSDLKPSNLMLTWLPSGKFQIKIVDFGLATLAQSQSKQDLESIEAVFGSIFFMPPEQFERSPLDARSDMYSMGCVYYQALTGSYPFDGSSGHEVMSAHLNHTVKSLKEVRSEIPLWVCDWIMWHLNRYPEDRPSSAKEALSVFLKNDRIPNPQMSLGIPLAPAGPPRARLIIPGSSTQPLSPTGPATQALAKAKLVQTSEVTAITSGAITQTAPQPLAPPEGFGESVHTTLLEPPTPGHATAQAVKHVVTVEKKPFKLGKNAKIGIAIAIGLMLLVLAVVAIKINAAKQKARIVDELIEQADKSGTTELSINRDTLQLLLTDVSKTESNSRIQKIGHVMTIAKASDGTDMDSIIADFVTKGPQLSPRAKEIMVSEVLRIRNNPVIMPAMLDLAKSSDDPAVVLAALQSVREMAGDGQFEGFLNLIQSTDNNDIRDAAAVNIEVILRKSAGPILLAKQLKTAYQSNVKPDIQRTLRHLVEFSNSVAPRGK